jgi:hypothetical protein
VLNSTGFFYFGDQVIDGGADEASVGGGVHETRDVIGSNMGFKIDRLCTAFAHRNQCFK